MFLERRKVKGKEKYYLAHTFREGGKVHKIRKYLGADLSKEALEERKAKAEQLIEEEIGEFKIIRDPLYTVLLTEEVEFVKKLEADANLSIVHLSEEDWKRFSEVFTYNTNAIEGSRLKEKEVKDVLEKDQWPKEASKTDIAESYGVNDAIIYIRETKDHLSLELIKKIHEIVFKNSKSYAGQFRKPGEEVVVSDGHGNIVHQGAPQSRVISLLNELIVWYGKHKSKYPALLLAAVIHNQFETIHPFADGNGRVGRLLLNHILIKHGLPPVNIDLKNQQEYYATLQAYQKEHNIRPTIELLLKEYKSLKKMVE